MGCGLRGEEVDQIKHNGRERQFTTPSISLRTVTYNVGLSFSTSYSFIIIMGRTDQEETGKKRGNPCCGQVTSRGGSKGWDMCRPTAISRDTDDPVLGCSS